MTGTCLHIYVPFILSFIPLLLLLLGLRIICDMTIIIILFFYILLQLTKILKWEREIWIFWTVLTRPFSLFKKK